MSEKRNLTSIIWCIKKRNDQSFWSAIGAAWQHEDCDGMILRFKLWPLAGQDVRAQG